MISGEDGSEGSGGKDWNAGGGLASRRRFIPSGASVLPAATMPSATYGDGDRGEKVVAAVSGPPARSSCSEGQGENETLGCVSERASERCLSMDDEGG